MASPWLSYLPLGLLASSWFRGLLRNAWESATCVHVKKGAVFKGETAEEAALHRQALCRSSMGMAIIIGAILGQGLAMTGSEEGCRRIADAVEGMTPSLCRLVCHACAAGMIIKGMIAEWIESPLHGNGNKAVIVRKLGYPSYWTCQTQVMVCSVISLSAFGEALLALGLMPSSGVVPAMLVAAPYRFSIMATVQSMLVTLLFSATMMGNDKWMENFVREKERQGIPAGWHQVLSHYTLPLAIPDLFLVRRSDVMRSLGLGFGGNLFLAAGYALLFCGFILLTYALTGEVQYGIVRPYLTPSKYPLVALAFLVLVSVVMSLCFFAVENCF